MARRGGGAARDCNTVGLGLRRERQADGTVVRAHDVRQDACGMDGIDKIVACKEVVETPAHVAVSCPRAHVPPSVVEPLFVEESEGIHESVTHQEVHPRSLRGEEPRRILVILGVGKVQSGMGCVHITADDESVSCLPECKYVLEEGIIEVELVLETLVIPLAIREVDVQESESGVCSDKDSSLSVQSLHAESQSHPDRLFSRIDGDPAVALTLRMVPVRGVPVRFE